MASHALAKAKELARRSRLRAGHEIAKREHTMIASTAAAIVGVAEAKGHRIPTVMGLDGTIVAGVVSLLLADNVGGSNGRILQSFADGMLAIGAYKMGRSVGGQAISGADDGSNPDVKAFEAVLAKV